MATPYGPNDGDIVIRPRFHNGRRRYVLQAAHGPDGVVFASRAAAVAQALAFAEHFRVDVWIADDDDSAPRRLNGGGPELA